MALLQAPLPPRKLRVCWDPPGAVVTCLFSLCLCHFCCAPRTSPAREAALLHAPPRPPSPAPCDQARRSVWPPWGPWGAPPPRWPPRPSRTTASPGAHPARGPRQRLAGVGAAPGGLHGATAWAPGSTRPHGPGPEGKQVEQGRPRARGRGCRQVPLLGWRLSDKRALSLRALWRLFSPQRPGQLGLLTGQSTPGTPAPWSWAEGLRTADGGAGTATASGRGLACPLALERLLELLAGWGRGHGTHRECCLLPVESGALPWPDVSPCDVAACRGQGVWVPLASRPPRAHVLQLQLRLDSAPAA